MLKDIKWKSILISVLYIAAGLLLVIYPKASADVICDVLGIACIAAGIINIASYFAMDLDHSLMRNDFVIGVMFIMVGALILYKKSLVFELVPFLLGAVITASGFMKLQDGIDAKRMGFQSTSNIYIWLAIVSIILGIVIMFMLPASTATVTIFTLIGIGLIYSGATDLYSTVYLSAKIKKFRKTVEQTAKAAVNGVFNGETGAPENNAAGSPADTPDNTADPKA